MSRDFVAVVKNKTIGNKLVSVIGQCACVVMALCTAITVISLRKGELITWHHDYGT